VLAISVIEISYSIAYHDALTGLPGRRALKEAFLELDGQYTIAMIDIDHFKKFNDRYGHDVGDHARKKPEKTTTIKGSQRSVFVTVATPRNR